MTHFTKLNLYLTWMLPGLFVFCTLSVPAQDGRGAGNVRLKSESGKIEEVKLYEGSFALVIGISNYTNGWKTLDGVKEDVPAVKAVLEKHGFSVKTVLNPTGEQLQAAINGFVRDYGYTFGNRLLIYYAGHGDTETAADGRKMGYIVPADAPLPSKDPEAFQRIAISMNDFEYYAQRIQAKHALFVFDSCFSGTMMTTTRGNVPSIINYKAALPVRQFITAGNDEQEVPDISEFRRQFVEGLNGEADTNSDGYITGSELADFLQSKVSNYSKLSQTPQYGKIRDGRLDKGDFVFILTRAAALAAPPAADQKIEATAVEKEFWDSIKNSAEIENFQFYKEKYPNGFYTNLADLKIRLLKDSQSSSQKKYARLSESEKISYITTEAEKLTGLLGEKTGNTVSPEGAALIRYYIDDYLTHTKAVPDDLCRSGKISRNLTTIFKCAEKVTPQIIRAFNSQGIAPQAGIYIAMIESEFQPCIQSPTGPLGLFQFIRAVAEELELKIVRDPVKIADDSEDESQPALYLYRSDLAESDERCNPEAVSAGAARYLKKAIIPRILRANPTGTPADNMIFSIAAWNSGQGGQAKNIETTKTELKKTKVNFWDLIKNTDNLSEQFKQENKQYIPKFFAAAIIGENPQAFDINSEPLSRMTN